jgi:transposase
MTDVTFWTYPPETAVCRSHSGEYTITVLDPPLPEGTAELSSHDRVRARAFAEAFPTVDAVLEELPPMPASEVLYAEKRTGVQWRDMPERFGPWKTVYERHRLWSADGTWERLLEQVQAAADAAGEIDWDGRAIWRSGDLGQRRCRARPCHATVRRAAAGAPDGQGGRILINSTAT